MKTELKNIIIILIIVSLLHIFSILFGWYETKIVWIDNLQHVLAGIALAMLFLLINKRKKINVILMLFFVLALGALWELFEFLFLQFLPFYAQKFSLYSPNFLEAFEDVLSNLIGVIIFSVWHLRKDR